MNVSIDQLRPGTFGVSHGSGLAAEMIRHATGSWAGHAFLYLGNGMLVQGQPPVAALAAAGSHDDAIWAWRMWDWLRTRGWDDEKITATQQLVAGRGHGLAGCRYDFEAYAGFALEVVNLRNSTQLAPYFTHDSYRVCSALVYDAEQFGGVPMDFVPADGPGLTGTSERRVLPPNLVAPGMLLGLAQRQGWL